MIARSLLGVLAGMGIAYAIAALLVLTITDFGVGIAIAAAAWMVIGCIRYVEHRRDETRLGREREWIRRDIEAARKVRR